MILSVSTRSFVRANARTGLPAALMAANSSALAMCFTMTFVFESRVSL